MIRVPLRQLLTRIVAAAFLPWSFTVVHAQEKPSRVLSVGQVAISPDGKRLAWVEGGRRASEIRVAPFDDLAKSARLTAATKPDQHCSEGSLTWAPDSTALAFFSDCAAPHEQ